MRAQLQNYHGVQIITNLETQIPASTETYVGGCWWMDTV